VHVPKPGAIEEGGVVKALVPFPDLQIRYTTDGSDPSQTSPLYNASQPPKSAPNMKLRTFTETGRASATVSLQE
jgi:hexosaminidase